MTKTRPLTRARSTGRSTPSTKASRSKTTTEPVTGKSNVLLLDAFQDGVERRVDLARVNGRVFVNNASMGLYAKIVQSPAYRDAKLKTAADVLPDMIGPDALPFDLRFVGPDGAECPSAHLLLVSNNPYELDHLAGRGTRKRIDLGTLGVVAARIASPAEAVTFTAWRRPAGSGAFGVARMGHTTLQRRIVRTRRDRHRRRGTTHGAAACVRVSAGRPAGTDPQARSRVGPGGNCGAADRLDRGQPRANRGGTSGGTAVT